jgi:hypothetical protein
MKRKRKGLVNPDDPEASLERIGDAKVRAALRQAQYYARAIGYALYAAATCSLLSPRKHKPYYRDYDCAYMESSVLTPDGQDRAVRAMKAKLKELPLDMFLHRTCTRAYAQRWFPELLSPVKRSQRKSGRPRPA